LDRRERPDQGVPAHRYRFLGRSAAESAFFTLNICLVIAICGSFIYFRWDDLGNGDFQYYCYGGIDFLSHPKLYDRIYMDKPPLAFLMYSPLAFLPGISKVATFFAIVIAAEAFLLRMLLRQLRFDEAACLGGTAFFLAAALFKSQLDFVSLSHLTNLLILGACIAAVRGSTRGVIIAGVLIAVAFYIRQNNVILALYPIILGRFSELRTLIVYATSVLVGVLTFFGLFCLISNIDLFIYTTFFYPFKYANMGIGAPPLGFRRIVWIFAQSWRNWLLLFLVLWCVAAWARVRLPVSGRQMALLFGVAFIAVVAPKKPFDHYQGYLLIWFGLLGAWAVHVLTSRFPRQWQGGLVWLAVGCAIVLVGAVAQREIKLSGELADAKNRLDHVLPEIRRALDSRPGHPTLQVFDAIYTLHETYDGLLLMLTGATPATPLIFTLLFSEESAFTLPPPFRDQWGLLAQKPPDVIVLKDVGESTDLTDVGPNFARSLHQFLASHGYRERALSNKVTIAERP
jgi:hypothetical protein